MARTPKNVQANTHVTSPAAAAVDPSADLVTEPSGQSAAELPQPVDAPVEGDEQKLAEDAADAAGIGSAHGDQPTDLIVEAADPESAADPISAAEFEIQLAGEPVDPIQAERLQLELRLAELGDPLERRRQLARKIEEEIEDHKHEEKAHAKRLGALRYELQLEAERGQAELEEIRLANIRLDQLKVLAEQKAAAIAEAARLAPTASTAAPTGDSA